MKAVRLLLTGLIVLLITGCQMEDKLNKCQQEKEKLLTQNAEIQQRSKAEISKIENNTMEIAEFLMKGARESQEELVQVRKNLAARTEENEKLKERIIELEKQISEAKK